MTRLTRPKSDPTSRDKMVAGDEDGRVHLQSKLLQIGAHLYYGCSDQGDRLRQMDVGAIKPMRADIDLDIGRKTFTSGLLPELIAALRRSRPGDLVALVADKESIRPELETWCPFTGNPLLEATVKNGRARFVFRCGSAALFTEASGLVGSRLSLYTNFDCNLHCDYCCVRSSPSAPARQQK